MLPNTIIALRPHFRRTGDDVYFFLSDRIFHSLTPAEATVWEKLQEGPLPAAALRADEVLRSMLDAGMLEAIDPVKEQDRRRILVVEPHCDDAALSIGATMWKMRHEVEFHLLTMASRSNYTSAFQLHRDRFDRAEITAIRKAEGELFAMHLGGEYHCAGLSEATLRYNDSDWDLDFFTAHEVSTAISNNRRAPTAVLEAWTERLRHFLTENPSFDEIWIPLGVGTHSDHDLARNATLRSLAEARLKKIIRVYEDVPYGSDFPEHKSRLLSSLEAAGAILSPWSQDVSREFSTKLALLGIFASQFKVRAVQDGVARSARSSAPSGQVEHLWTLEKLPRHLPEDEMWVNAPAVAKTAAKLRRFKKDAHAARRVALFAITAPGRWTDDLHLLRELFPAARFVVYANRRVCAEFCATHNPRVELHCLEGTSGSWLRAALRELPTQNRIVIAADAVRKAKLLRMLWPTGRTILCSAMDDLCQALQSTPGQQSND